MRTDSLVKTAQIIYNSDIYFGSPGGLMHLSQGLGKKACIIFGGYERPENSGYQNNINIFKEEIYNYYVANETRKYNEINCLIKPQEVAHALLKEISSS